MAGSRARRIATLIGANLGVTLGLFAAIESACRRLEAHGANHKRSAVSRRLPAKAPGELRVMLFGGSSVYGQPVPEIAFAAQMRYWLKRLYPERDIRIYNFGYPGAPTLLVRSEFMRRLEDRPDLMVLITGHNEFMWPDPPAQRISGFRDALDKHSAAMREVEALSQWLRRGREADVNPVEVDPWDQRSARSLRRVEAFEQEMSEMVAKARERGVKLIVGTLPSNLADWPPAYQRLPNRDARYAAAISYVQQLIREQRYREAADAVSSGFQRYPDDAMLHYLCGKIQASEGDYAGARASFVKARDLDAVQWRTSSRLNGIIRKAAAGGNGVELLDMEKIYEERAANGLVGLDLIGDNVHGAPAGEAVAAQAIIGAVSRMGFLGSSQAAVECCPVSRFLTDAGYFQPRSPLHLAVLLKNAVYVMKTPFWNYDLSRHYLLEAMQVDDHSWEVWANLATMAYLTGDGPSGAKELEQATLLRHAPLDANDRERTPYMKEALRLAGGYPKR